MARPLALLALLGGCAKPAPPETPAPASVGVVEVRGNAPAVPERDAILRVLAAAPPTACYEAALARNGRAHGEVVVRFRLDAAGAVAEASPTYSTLGDEVAAACVADAVRALRFPPPSRPDLVVVYPFLFTSDTTPPEVARALKLRYGLVTEEIPGDPTDPKTPIPPGLVVTW